MHDLSASAQALFAACVDDYGDLHLGKPQPESAHPISRFLRRYEVGGAPSDVGPVRSPAIIAGAGPAAPAWSVWLPLVDGGASGPVIPGGDVLCPDGAGAFCVTGSVGCH